MLLDAGADPTAIERNGQNPLNIAKDWRHHAVVKLLEPVTNDDYECPSSKDESETDDYESEGDPCHESGKENEADNREPEGAQSPQFDLTVRPKDPTPAE